MAAAVDAAVWILATVFIAVQAQDDYDVKLVNGSTDMEGIPLFYFGFGDWRPLCDNYIKPEVATIICRQLKLPTTMIRLNNAYTGNWSDLFRRCDNTAYDLLGHCYWNDWPDDRSCPGSIGIRCGGNVRFVGGDFLKGQVQVYEGGTWHAFCKADTGYSLANVACNQMGLTIYQQTAAAIIGLSYSTIRNGTITLAGSTNGSRSITCVGNETRLDQCVIEAVDETCPPEDTYIVTCNATLIEIMFAKTSQKKDCANITHLNQFEEDVLRKQCEEENNAFPLFITHVGISGFWCGPKILTESEQLERNMIASVACFELRYSRYDFKLFIIDHQEDPFRIGPGQLICTGREDNLTSCTRHADLDYEPCDNETDDYFSLLCKSPIRLDAGKGSSGPLSLQDQTTGVLHWIHVANAQRGLVRVVCRELGYNSANVGLLGAELLGHIPGRTMLGMRLDCFGEEELLKDCYFTPDDSLVASNQAAVFGVDCNASFTHVEMLNTSFPSRGLLMMNATRDSTMTYVCAYDLDEDERSKLAAVLCHQVGFSRLGADLLINDNDTLMLNGTTTTSGFIDVRWRCLGKEKTISECLLYRAPEITNCSTLFSLSCQNNTYCEAEHDYVQQKYIMCHSMRCHKLEDCKERKPQKCNLRTSACYTKTAIRWGERYSDSTHCSKDCRPRSQKSKSLFQHSCCYSNWCNAVNRDIPAIHYQYRLKGDFKFRNEDEPRGFLPYDGYVQVNRSGKWIYLEDDENYSATYLNWLCTSTGHYTSDATRLPTERIDGKCTKVSDEETCVSSTGIHGACAGDIRDCNGRVLNLRCNAAPSFTRLVAGSFPEMGRVEVSYNGEWGTICTQGLTLASVGVICRSLGYLSGCGRSSVTDPAVRFRPGEGTIHFTNIRCEGWEPNIWKCKMDLATSCSHGEDLHIICPEARLNRTLPPETVQNKTSGITKSGEATGRTFQNMLRCPDQLCATFPCVFTKKLCLILSKPGYCSVTRVTLPNGDHSYSFQCQKQCDNGLIRDDITGVILQSLNSPLCCTTTNCTAVLLSPRNDTATDDVELDTPSSGYRHNGRDSLVGVVTILLLLVMTFTARAAL